jgi:hypothetical protein
LEFTLLATKDEDAGNADLGTNFVLFGGCQFWVMFDDDLGQELTIFCLVWGFQSMNRDYFGSRGQFDDPR